MIKMRKGAREIVFVCSAIVENTLTNKIIAAASPDEAADSFFKEFGMRPQESLGPFYKKRTQVLETTRTLKLTNQSKKAVYNEWIVTAFILEEPVNYAYLVFLKRTDNKKVPAPKGVVIVPISNLRFV
jgi:hypothetical protein